MRRIPSVLLVAALALGTTAFAPAPQTTSAASTSAATAEAAAQQIVICVRFQEWTVPVVGYTWEPEYERFCVEAPDVNPSTLPGSEGSL